MDGGVLRAFDQGMLSPESEGCAFVLDDGTRCSAERQAGSAYCTPHHTRCYIPNSSWRARRRLREVEALADAVGGRRGRAARTPPERFLRRLEDIARRFARPNRSCIVPGSEP